MRMGGPAPAWPQAEGRQAGARLPGRLARTLVGCYERAAGCRVRPAHHPTFPKILLGTTDRRGGIGFPFMKRSSTHPLPSQSSGLKHQGRPSAPSLGGRYRNAAALPLPRRCFVLLSLVYLAVALVAVPSAAAIIDSSPKTDADGDGTMDTYGAGETIVVRTALHPSDYPIVIVTGTPYLDLTIGNTIRRATYTGQDRYARNMYFAYTVQATDADTDGISIPTTMVLPPGAAIQDAEGNNLAFALSRSPVINGPEHRVDGSITVPAKADRLSVSSSPATGTTYGAGETIEVWVVFDKLMTVDTASGTPYLALTIGSNTRRANYIGPFSFLTPPIETWLLFAYTVQTGDAGTDGISIPAGALELNGGTIRDTAGTDANLDLGTLAITDADGH